VLLVPLVPLVPPAPLVPRVPVPVLGRRVSQHAVPPLRQIAFAPFFAVLPHRLVAMGCCDSLQAAVQVVAA